MNELEQRVADEIRRRGPVPFSEVMDLALYDPEHGFYASGGAAGRRGDFITSPEVGPLFGAVVARALDEWWRATGRARSVRGGRGRRRRGHARRSRCSPRSRRARRRCGTCSSSGRRRCARAKPSTWRSRIPALAFAPDRAEDEDGDIRPPEVATGPIVVSLDSLPRLHGRSVVVANELLDNLAGRPPRTSRRPLVRGAGRARRRPAGRDARARRRTGPRRAGRCTDPGADGRATRWVRDARESRRRASRSTTRDTTASMATRDPGEWLRTYRGHQRGGAPARRPRRPGHHLRGRGRPAARRRHA